MARTGDLFGKIGSLANAQRGYFTTAQAVERGVHRDALTRAVKSGRIERLDQGVYRIRHAGHDKHRWVRVPYMRLDPAARPATVMHSPRVWVSGRTAAAVHGYGAMSSPVLTFCSSRRIRVANDRAGGREFGELRITHLPEGVPSEDWVFRDGFALLSVERIASDLLLNEHVDGDHVGRFIRDAVRAGTTSPECLSLRVGVSVSNILQMVEHDYQ